MSELVLGPWSSPEAIRRDGGGKAANLHALTARGYPVPPWICISALAYDRYGPGSELDGAARAEIGRLLTPHGLSSTPVAVRSSGLEEDAAELSFAGQFESFLYQQGEEQIFASIRRCWESAHSARITAYRAASGGARTDVRMGVVIQKMVESESAGVAFSRNPLRPGDRATVVVESVWGQGEGLVGGAVDADRFEVDRNSLCIRAQLADKSQQVVRDGHGGTRTVALDPARAVSPSLAEDQIRAVAALAVRLETDFGAPQDCEWAFAGGELFCLQTRPITTLPPDSVFDAAIAGIEPIIWDNSNIIESYAGVTTPLTFTHVNRYYREFHVQFSRVMCVPEAVIAAHEPVFRNMLGLVRGRVYYNLVNWYRLLALFPGVARSKGFMETMMGVKQSLTPELAGLLDPLSAPRYPAWRRAALAASTAHRLTRTKHYVRSFMQRIERVYHPLESADLRQLNMMQQLALYTRLEEEVLKKWTAPIVSDTRCMVAFGLLKELTSRWIEADGAGESGSLQNDLLCGEGDLKSTEPTRMLMRIAEAVDHGDAAARERFLAEDPRVLWQSLAEGFAPDARSMFDDFLARYGFRCADELKLEEPDLHDDPGFAIASVQSYIRLGKYGAADMEGRELTIRREAEARVRGAIAGPRRWIYFRVLRWARRAVSDREMLRFERTRTFGVTRRLFRALGANLTALRVIEQESDVFYLTIDELMEFTEGRSVAGDFRPVVAARRREFDEYRRTPAPPDRFVTRGAATSSMRYSGLLAENDLLASDSVDDPDLFRGTPCSPGVVEGTVRVARTFEEAAGMQGEILVTERTDPGWVPLFPACGGLIIERGSLLSHSAVVARELGIPTIVGVGGHPVQRLKTGQRVRMDAGRGEVRVL
ncbi:MAG: PEP/pyruvate-binding domain-containing protein [Gemmatimonadaceae bacterium]